MLDQGEGHDGERRLTNVLHLGDLLQACTQDLEPGALTPLLACMNEDPVTIPENFLACATKIGLDGPRVKACADGDAGQALLRASFDEADKRGVEGSPTLFVGGRAYEGARTPLALLRVVCNAYDGAKPEACEGVPPPKAVPMTVLADKRCPDCPTEVGINSLKAVIPEVEAKVLDYGAPEGKALWDSVHAEGVKYLPIFLFAKELVADPENVETFEQIEPYLHPIAGYRMLATSSDFDPTAEICDNGVDDDANGMADCDDPACKGKPICRPEEKGRLDLFVMSQCPYALRAEASMREVRAAFGDAMDFRMHFIVVPEGAEFVAQVARIDIGSEPCMADQHPIVAAVFAESAPDMGISLLTLGTGIDATIVLGV